ncbi:uncharacterized protein LOC102069276 isoform X11 [Zonotrichia albicollis]|uniref:uncharacterized protein LOC102069276 isoform X11 n=1 Tax=Zonotrichia albicollis TaxID=44394 RepID=UPI003D80F0D6
MAGGLEFELDCTIFFMIQPNSPFLAEWSHLPGNFHRDSYEFIATEPSPVIICCKRADQKISIISWKEPYCSSIWGTQQQRSEETFLFCSAKTGFVAQFEAKRHWAMLFRGVLMSSFLKPGFSYLHLKRLSTGWDIHLGQIKTWNTTSGAKKLLFLATCHQH